MAALVPASERGKARRGEVGVVDIKFACGVWLWVAVALDVPELVARQLPAVEFPTSVLESDLHRDVVRDYLD